VKTLVFLEHHEGAIQKGSLGVLAKAASVGDVAGVLVGSGVRSLAETVGAPVYVADDERLAAPLPQPRVDVLAQLVRDEGFDTVLFAQSVLAADVAAGLAARLDAGLNWGLVDFDGTQGRAPQLQDTVVVDVAWTTPVRIGIFRAGALDATPLSGSSEVRDAAVELEDFSTQAEMVEQAHAEQ
jgi:electron transfer flavoprotein alpha subunit